MPYLTQQEDTIVAIATPPGQSALGVVRLSGPRAWPIAGELLRRDCSAWRPRCAEVGRARDVSGNPLDRIVLLPWSGPASSTGEDLVELFCHGAPVVLELVLSRLVALGARLAAPGEFSFRSFVHGKLALHEAEAVQALISAQTRAAAKGAMGVLDGRGAERLHALRDRLVHLLSLLELELDFSEEEGVLQEKALLRDLASLQAALTEDLALFRAGLRLQQGATVLLLGAPNVGKSTLLNRIAGFDRALVHDAPGTTRDYLEVTVSLEGLPIRFVDTAGLRDEATGLERAGGERARSLIAGADLLLWLVAPPDWRMPDASLLSDPRLILVRNKRDLAATPPAGLSDLAVFPLSARDGEGMDELRSHLGTRLLEGVPPGEALSASLRHVELLRACAEDLHDIHTRLHAEGPLQPELLSSDLRAILDRLDAITGHNVTEEILERVFSGFCIGK